MTPAPSATFARRLREERERAGLSQNALAQRLSEMLEEPLDPTAMTRIETGKRQVKVDEAVAIAQALGLPLPLLLSDGSEVDERIADLRRDLLEAQWQEQQAEAQLQRAQDSVRAIRRAIAELVDARPQDRQALDVGE